MTVNYRDTIKQTITFSHKFNIDQPVLSTVSLSKGAITTLSKDAVWELKDAVPNTHPEGQT